jgi:hypothetical protein
VLMASLLNPARAASSSWVRPAAVRWCRSRSAKVTDEGTLRAGPSGIVGLPSEREEGRQTDDSGEIVAAF